MVQLLTWPHIYKLYMGLIDFFYQMASDYTIQTIVMGTAVLGLLSGLLGTWAVLRRQSLLGDAVAHAALPGIAIAFLISGEKNTLFIFAGAAVAGWIATLWIRGIAINTRIKSDTALAVVLAVFFGFGMVLITLIQQMPNARQAGLESFLFGQAATLLRHDVAIMAIIAGVAVVTVFLFWKEFKLLAFDQQYANSLGFNIKFLDILLNTLIVIAIVIGLQAVGVVLMSALLIAPAAAARQWTNKLGDSGSPVRCIGYIAFGCNGKAANRPFDRLVININCDLFISVCPTTRTDCAIYPENESQKKNCARHPVGTSLSYLQKTQK